MSVATPPPFHFIPVISFSHHWTEAPTIFYIVPEFLAFSWLFVVEPSTETFSFA